MKKIHKKLPKRRKNCVATIGVFDGVHSGHRFILETASRQAKKDNLASLAITFDLPPRLFLARRGYAEKGYSRKSDSAAFLTTNEEKARLISLTGIDYLWFLATAKRLLQLSPEGFLDHIYRYFNIRKLVVGEDFRFGYKGEGDAGKLKRLLAAYDAGLVVVKRIKKHGKVISSSLIRDLINRGEITEANSFLGRHYSLEGLSVKGKGIGRKLGYPTVNLTAPQHLIPCCGVYAGYLNIKNNRYLCAINIGVSPTLKKKKRPVIEIHAINPDKLPRKSFKLFFLERLRGEKRFPSLEALKAAIAKNIRYIVSKYSILPS